MLSKTNTNYQNSSVSTCQSQHFFLTQIEPFFFIISTNAKFSNKQNCTLLHYITRFSRYVDFILLTRKSFSSLQNFLNICHHYSLDILQLCVDTAQVPPGPAVNVCLLCFLDVCVWNSIYIYIYVIKPVFVLSAGNEQFFIVVIHYTTNISQTVLPNSMKEYGLVTVDTFLPYWS